MKWYDGTPFFKNVTDTLNARPQTRYMRAVLRRNMQKRIQEWEHRVRQSDPAFKQAKHLAQKMGIVQICLTLGMHPNVFISTKLGLTKEGTENVRAGVGLLNQHELYACIAAARHWGILLTVEDIYPDFFKDGHPYFPSIKWEDFIKNHNKRKTSEGFKKWESDLVSLVSTPA